MPEAGRGRLLVIGGYGQVGRVVSARLARSFPGQVIAAGRDLARATALAEEIGHGLEPARLDLDRLPEPCPLLDEVGLVIVCIEQPDARFARRCLARGIHYLDISAGYPILRQIEALHPLAAQQHATAVLSVGLCPGLTNLLARHLVTPLSGVESLDISLLLGLGDAHGADAVRWLLRSASRPFAVETGAAPRLVQPLTDPRSVPLPPPFGRRTLYRFDLADQHVLPRTLGMRRVEGRLCFDSVLATRALVVAARLGLLRLTRRLDPRLLAGLLARLPLGGDGFAAQVEATGPGGRRALASVSGHGEARATGIVAAVAAETLLGMDPPGGVYHIEQLFEPAAILRQCQAAGFAVALDGPDARISGDDRPLLVAASAAPGASPEPEPRKEGVFA